MPTKERTIPKGYKQTDIGIIPSDWEVKKLGRCLMKSPRYGIGAAAVEYSDQLPKYIRITDISEDGWFLPEKQVSVNHILSENYFLADGDLVVARTGASVGKSYLYRPADGPLVFAGFLICLVPNKDILLPQYLEAYFKGTSYWNWVGIISMRSGQPGINGNEYAQLPIPLPKITEQKVINEVLSDTDSLIEKLTNLIEKKKSIKQGAMQELLTGKRRLPGFSKKWEKVELGLLLDYEQPQKYLVSSIKYDDAHDIPVLTVGKTFVLGYTNESTGIFKDLPCIIFDDFTTESRYVDFPFKAKSSAMKMLLPKSETVNLRFIFEKMQQISLPMGDHKRHWISEFQYLEISLPEPNEQEAITTTLVDMDNEIRELEREVAKYRDIKRGMMQTLLTGKIRLI